MYNMGFKLNNFLRKGVSFSFCSCRTAYIVRNNAKAFTSVGLSFKDIILFSKKNYVVDVVYVKSNSITWSFSDLKVVATL